MAARLVARRDPRKQMEKRIGNDTSLKIAYENLRDLIVRGKLSPGSRLVEAELAGRLGISRTPVRGALHWLQREGYISVTSASGGKSRLAVSPLTKDDARELYWIVGHVEGLAARLAAQLKGNVRTALIKKLRKLNEELHELAEARRPDPNRIFDIDMTFHKSIVEAAAGPRLLALHGAIKPQTERYWRLYASGIFDQLGLSVAEHTRIIRGITVGDGEAAARAIRTNWENGADRLSTVIDTLGERGSW